MQAKRVESFSQRVPALFGSFRIWASLNRFNAAIELADGSALSVSSFSRRNDVLILAAGS